MMVTAFGSKHLYSVLAKKKKKSYVALKYGLKQSTDMSCLMTL